MGPLVDCIFYAHLLYTFLLPGFLLHFGFHFGLRRQISISCGHENKRLPKFNSFETGEKEINRANRKYGKNEWIRWGKHRKSCAVMMRWDEMKMGTKQ